MLKHPDIKLVLDTHVFLWLINGDKGLSPKGIEIVLKKAEEGSIALSAISLWEISMLYARQRILLNQPCLNWINKSLEAPSIVLYPLTPEIAVETSTLPGTFHGDPADRIIVATARILSVPLLTKDQGILDYGSKSYLECLKA